MVVQVSKPSVVVRFAQVADQMMGERGVAIAKLAYAELAGSQRAVHT